MKRSVLETVGVAAGGDGIARHEDGRVVFVEGAIPGDRVRAEVVQEKKDFLKARTVEVLDPSPDRVVPPCPEVARGCGGCQWQHVSREAQLRLKRDIVVDALRRLARLPDPPVHEEVRAIPATAYRTTMRFAVLDGRVAFRRRRSHDLLAPAACLVAHPHLQQLMAHGRFRGVEEVLLRVGVAGGERLAVTDPAGAPIDVPPDVQVGAGAAVHEEVAGRAWRVSALSFFQSGPEAADLLVHAIAEAADEAAGPQSRKAVVVDAYSGVGVLGGALAGATGARLVAIEDDSWAAADAEHNLADLRAEVVRTQVADWAPQEADLVIADPARSGLGRSAAAALTATGARALVLVSCDPASLARDATLLAERGYRLDRTRVLDLFPNTFHVEAVSRFARTSRS